jgi:hypothetical protein
VIAGGVGLSGLLSLVLTPVTYRLIHLGRQGKAIENSNRLTATTELSV